MVRQKRSVHKVQMTDIKRRENPKVCVNLQTDVK